MMPPFLHEQVETVGSAEAFDSGDRAPADRSRGDREVLPAKLGGVAQKRERHLVSRDVGWFLRCSEQLLHVRLEVIPLPQSQADGRSRPDAGLAFPTLFHF